MKITSIKKEAFGDEIYIKVEGFTGRVYLQQSANSTALLDKFKETILKNKILESHKDLVNAGYYVGGKCIVFDANEWRKTGDIGNNYKFYVSAVILEVEINEDNVTTVNVMLSTGKISRGHFIHTLQPYIGI